MYIIRAVDIEGRTLETIELAFEDHICIREFNDVMSKRCGSTLQHVEIIKIERNVGLFYAGIPFSGGRYNVGMFNSGRR